MSTLAKKAVIMPILILYLQWSATYVSSHTLRYPSVNLQCTRRSHRVLHRIFEQFLCNFTHATYAPLCCSTALRPSVPWHSRSWDMQMEDCCSYPWRLARVRVVRPMAHCEDPAIGLIGWQVILPRDATAALAPLEGYVSLNLPWLSLLL